MHPPALDESTERSAVNLLRHLEWQAEGFSLVFLFASVGPALQLADWLDQRLRPQGLPLNRREANDDFARDPEALVDAVIAQLGVAADQRGALWLGLQRHPGDAQWNQARSRFLARLNERRFLLERDLRRPLVLVLPADFRPEARSIAPDLWHVRALSEELRGFGPATLIDARSNVAPVPDQAKRDDALPAYLEWQRIQDGATADQAFLPTAWSACDELLSAGRPGDAEQVALRALALARHRSATPTDNSATRNISIALDCIGKVARAQGNWAEAEVAYQESLSLCRQQIERVGATPETLHDLSVSLDNEGDVACSQGEWAQAGAVYRESLALRYQRIELLGGTPTADAVRHISASLDRIGNVAYALGEWTQAEAAYDESLKLNRQLLDRLGATTETLRELAASLDKVGKVASVQGNWTQAEVVYGESLKYIHQMVEFSGRTPKALRDLSVALNNSAEVAFSQRDWVQAKAVFGEALSLDRQMVERSGGTVEALSDLATSLNNMGAVHAMCGDWAQAESVYLESLDLRRQLVERLDSAPEALNELAKTLLNLAKIPPGNLVVHDEAIGILESLAAQFPDIPEYLALLTARRASPDTSH